MLTKIYVLQKAIHVENNYLTQFYRTKPIKQIDKTEETSSECEDDNQYAFTAINVCKEEKRPTTDY